MVCAEARKSRLRGGGQPFRVPPIRCRKTRHQPHQPHIGPEMPVDMVAEVPLAGLSFYPSASRDVDKQKDALLDEISRRLEQQTTCETLFTLRWRVK